MKFGIKFALKKLTFLGYVTYQSMVNKIYFESKILKLSNLILLGLEIRLNLRLALIKYFTSRLKEC